jgi:hypothetical protein
VNGARIHDQVHGDLSSGKTPLLVRHGSYLSAESMTPLVERFAIPSASASRSSSRAPIGGTAGIRSS